MLRPESFHCPVEKPEIFDPEDGNEEKEEDDKDGEIDPE